MGVLLYHDITRVGRERGRLGGMTLIDSDPPVTLYSQPGCGPCAGVATALDRMGVPYVKRDIRDDVDAYNRLVQLGYTGTPVVEHPNGHFKGFDPVEIENLRTLF